MQIQTRACAATCLLLLWGRAARAQSLEDMVNRLFLLGDHTVPLQVSGPAVSSQPGGGVENDGGFEPSAVRTNANVLSFLSRWIAGAPGHFPMVSTSGGVTFTFEGGLPEVAGVPAGPIFAEQGRTLGKGRAVVGARVTGTKFNTLKGKPIENLRVNFTHTNVDSDQCDAREGRDCAPLGVPLSENDLLELLLTLDLHVSVASLFVSYGLFDWLELGVVVPIVHTSLDARSVAQVLPFGVPSPGPSHFIAGTAADPVLASTQTAHGSATGFGDVGGRLKLSVVDGPVVAVALLGDMRAPTGDERDFLGTGEWEVRGLAVVSLHSGRFSPHLNAGYIRRGGNSGRQVGNDAGVATAGFDASVAPWASFSADLISELQLGRSVFRLPPPVAFTAPAERSVRPIEVPNARDDELSVSLGLKFATLSNLTGVANSHIPIAGGGPRPGFAWTLGLEYDF